MEERKCLERIEQLKNRADKIFCKKIIQAQRAYRNGSGHRPVNKVQTGQFALQGQEQEQITKRKCNATIIIKSLRTHHL